MAYLNFGLNRLIEYYLQAVILYFSFRYKIFIALWVYLNMLNNCMKGGGYHGKNKGCRYATSFNSRS